jgi:hypothetical protein
MRSQKPFRRIKKYGKCKVFLEGGKEGVTLTNILDIFDGEKEEISSYETKNKFIFSAPFDEAIAKYIHKTS